MYFCHEGKGRNPHALCDDEVTLTASQDVHSKVKLAGGKKNQTNFIAEKPYENK